MARRSLGRHWLELSEAGREEFARLLGRHVDARLITLAGFTGDAIEYTGETMEDETAIVATTIAMTSGRSMSLGYLMRRGGG